MSNNMNAELDNQDESSNRDYNAFIIFITIIGSGYVYQISSYLSFGFLIFSGLYLLANQIGRYILKAIKTRQDHELKMLSKSVE